MAQPNTSGPATPGHTGLKSIAPVPAAGPVPRTIQAPAILLMGETGSGKSYSISTLLESGLEVFVIGTEPTFLDTLLDTCMVKKDRKEYIHPNLHWSAIQPARVGIKGLQEMANKIAVMDYKALSELKPDGQRQHSQFIKFLATLANFTDDRTGEIFGSVDSWDDSRVLVIDSLSGLNLMAWDLTVGNKVSAHQGEWGTAMGTLDKLLLNLTSNLRCFFVLMAHLEREGNELTQGTQITVSTLGKKLAPKIPRFFSEVVMTYREGSNFYWSTTTTGVALKKRSLPFGDKLLPSFKPVVEAHFRRKSALA